MTNAMYYNWLNYYVYQVTPYDLGKRQIKQRLLYKVWQSFLK
mgnify:CR=1 FL=1